jgi:diguanylate cyclase (GGDEF)-like protein
VESAVGLAERLRLVVEQLPLDIPATGEPARVTISAGVAGVDTAATGSITDLIARADAALYSAKTSGRNRVIQASGTPPA